MKSLDALPLLAELTAGQWGMVTTAQAEAVGVSRLQLSRLAQRGLLERMAHGVYRDAGSAPGEWDPIRAAWISTDSRRTAEERITSGDPRAVVGGSTAAHLHGYGDLQPEPYDFITSKRRQSQRSDVRYRQDQLDPHDVTIVAGLPTTAIERTIADLVLEDQDLSLVADVLADAVRAESIDLDRLADLLEPAARRPGRPADDGAGFLRQLLELGGVDAASRLQRALEGASRGNTTAFNAIQVRIGEEIAKSLSRSILETSGVLPDISRIASAAIGRIGVPEIVSESVARALRPQTGYISEMLLSEIRGIPVRTQRITDRSEQSRARESATRDSGA
ncbi:type IV toxin-antitoxin system AbiEi family antitoxin domain-containing protein [Clavibacter michiganensis]|uniref:type IV toxin-antitoxin system AbiEi family antitoxin domain-containing protein n=1 Tax=Clavibacter michiganensis TaxID=28447 RepID=UPI00345BB72C